MENGGSRRFGRYEVVAELGRGAMGVVYKARDPHIDRFVAVKTVSMLGQEPEEEQEFRLRFSNEAQAAGRLHHSGIVSVFDVGEDPENHDPYIVLEFVSGETLNRVLSREKKLSPTTALQLAIEIADALDYAHVQGVVHRDIKPANILVTQEGHAKIADFGIAKLNLAHFTLPGRVLGTPAYMAPEQLGGEAADGRSDLFSLGVILYVMVTGLSPFQGNSATTVCFKVANREPMTPSALDMSLPPEIDAIISKAMAKDPDQRYQRGSEFADDLRQLLQLYKPGSTTSSLQALTSTGTSSVLTRTGTAASVSAARTATAVAQTEKVVKHVLFKVPVRDLILGAGTVLLLVIVATQTKLLVNSSKPGLPPAAVSENTPVLPQTPEPPSSVSVTPDKEKKPVQVAASASPKLKRASTKASRPVHPAIVPAPVPGAAPATVAASSTLDLSVQHQFKDATLYVWVDGNLALTRPLHGGAQKKLVVFNGVRGIDSESLTIPAGKHLLRFRALSTDQTIDLSKTLSADFVAGDTKSLQLIFDKHNASIRTTWQ